MGQHRACRLKLDSPATYRIRVAGGIDASWRGRLGELDFVVSGADPRIETTLTGRLADQAALTGVLNSLYDHGLPILSVECLAWE